FNNTGIVTGPLFVTLTNLNTGKTVGVNISGPALLTFSSIGTTNEVGMGPGLLVPAPLSVTSAAGLPPVPLLHGRSVFTADAQGNVVSIQSFVGQVEDVCQMLR